MLPGIGLEGRFVTRVEQSVHVSLVEPFLALLA